MRVSSFLYLLPVYGTAVHAQTTNLTVPPPCVRASPPPSACQTEARFNEFADAFLVQKNITKAFTFIVSDYIVSAQQPSATALLEKHTTLH